MLSKCIFRSVPPARRSSAHVYPAAFRKPEGQHMSMPQRSANQKVRSACLFCSVPPSSTCLFRSAPPSSRSAHVNSASQKVRTCPFRRVPPTKRSAHVYSAAFSRKIQRKMSMLQDSLRFLTVIRAQNL